MADSKKKNEMQWNGLLDGTPNWGKTYWGPIDEVESMYDNLGNRKTTLSTDESTSGITGSSSGSLSYGSGYSSGRPTYKQSDDVTAAWNKVTELEGQKPGDYVSKYGDQIQSLLDRILNRDPFKYDFNADPMYQMYKDRYLQQGRMAMQDTMGDAAALTGGYGNSYAATAGQQAYQSYLQGLNDRIPGLRDFAYNAWLNEGDRIRSNLSTLQGLDDTDYGRYRDTVGDYYTDLNYYYGKFGDLTDRDYARYLDAVAAWEKDRDYMTALATAARSTGNSSRHKDSKDTGKGKTTPSSESYTPSILPRWSNATAADRAANKARSTAFAPPHVYESYSGDYPGAWDEIEKVANSQGKYAAQNMFKEYVDNGLLRYTDANIEKLKGIQRSGR